MEVHYIGFIQTWSAFWQEIYQALLHKQNSNTDCEAICSRGTIRRMTLKRGKNFEEKNEYNKERKRKRKQSWKYKTKKMTRWHTNIYALSPWSRVVIEKVLVAEVIKKSIAIYVARQFIQLASSQLTHPVTPWESIKIAAKETISLICGNPQVFFYYLH